VPAVPGSITSEVMPVRQAPAYPLAMQVTDASRPVGHLLRTWRTRRRLSQMELALGADISTRHLSFLETGRSVPSREMLLRLAARLDVPLRERNNLLLAAGYAPAFRERALDDPALAAARRAIDLVLAGHEPYPAIAVDRLWNMVASNRAVAPMLIGVAPSLLQPPVNVMRLALHPDGLAPSIENLGEWRGHLLARLQRQLELTGDPRVAGLMEELSGYPVPPDGTEHEPDARVVALPLRLRTPGGTLNFISTITVFGTPVDVTLSEIALETFFPADAATQAFLQGTGTR
jgi:transcriptional regulator with XRE-family HTH domain